MNISDSNGAQSISEFACCWSNQGISHLISNPLPPKFHHRIHNSKLQAHTNPDESSRRPSILPKINFNIILRSKARFCK